MTPGGIAQLVEHMLCKHRVAGSNPTTSTQKGVRIRESLFSLEVVLPLYVTLSPNPIEIYGAPMNAKKKTAVKLSFCADEKSRTSTS